MSPAGTTSSADLSRDDTEEATARPSGVLVAIDGSDSAQTALAWAAREARERGVPLAIAHCYHWPSSGLGAMEAVGFLMDSLAAESAEVLQAAVEHVHRTEPDVEVSTESILGAPTPALIDRSHHRELLVVGSRGLGGFAGMLLGSVSTGVVAHAACPVVVVRNDREIGPSDPVVVGLDGSAASSKALVAALEFASRRGCPVLAVHAWQGPGEAVSAARRHGRVTDSTYDEAWGQSVSAAVAEQLEPARDQFPDVDIDTAVSNGRPTEALLHRAQGARLVVVGTRGRGELKSLILGSTSRAMVQHAPCPVMVVR